MLILVLTMSEHLNIDRPKEMGEKFYNVTDTVITFKCFNMDS